MVTGALLPSVEVTQKRLSDRTSKSQPVALVRLLVHTGSTGPEARQ